MSLGLPPLIGAVLVVRDALDDAPSSPRLALIPPFGQIAFRVTDRDDEFCALLASTPEAQTEGMQGKASLMGYDAMVFRFDQDTSVSFVNHFVPIDLSIGWYDARGRLVDHTTMEKCPSGQNCPTYASKKPFRYAVETPSGGLDALGLTGSGATLQVGGSCG